MITTLDCRHIFYDINIRLDFYPQPILRQSLDRSTIVKLNLEELQMVTERLFGKALEERQFAEQLFGDHAVDVVCVTKGSCGCSVHTQNQVANASAPQVKVADTVGSGDAFSAGFLYKYCRGASIEAAAQTANMLGAFVASCHGAVPTYHAEIQRQLSL